MIKNTTSTMQQNHSHSKATLALELGRAQNELRSRLRQSIQIRISETGHDISFELLEIIGLLWREDGIHQQEIGDHLSKDKSSVTYLINALVKRGLVTRVEHDKDRRHKKIFLTSQGKALRKVIYPLVLDCYAQAAGDIAPALLLQSTTMIRQMAGNL
ncbi:DNA-binding transcriptional regulator, MarR family [Arachidicoccus rhizosphaerae]|jgi:DNA-binding MarR family transcriptional regulator|uniref:DNA-binding transcriptional regulator, MarR family n=1 Tax=Arachidicoccus rhizosphaerae TaxID=551991 RepID=A0A1H4AUJ2_9BACT|nr:MarR family transcriptional regulator [Arachidicoccus rhizosphaerae]SEA39468.1 DNA-binding transcriptional regulator, MarR family [Arachidicoccus rhizosphaerae]